LTAALRCVTIPAGGEIAVPTSDSSPTDSFDLRTETRGDTLVVRAFGELDLSVVPRFEEEVGHAVLGTAMRVLLDLSEVWFIDSSGLRAIVKGEELAVAHGKEFRIWGQISQSVERAFDVTGLAERMPFEGGPLP
jgi:anti-anti-sigma factor